MHVHMHAQTSHRRAVGIYYMHLTFRKVMLDSGKADHDGRSWLIGIASVSWSAIRGMFYAAKAAAAEAGGARAPTRKAGAEQHQEPQQLKCLSTGTACRPYAIRVQVPEHVHRGDKSF